MNQPSLVPRGEGVEALRPLRFDGVICENARKDFERERYGERELVCVVWLSILLHVTQRIYAFEFKSENRVHFME